MCRSIHERRPYQRKALRPPILLTEEYRAVGDADPIAEVNTSAQEERHECNEILADWRL
jgi:hypothetical protein